MSSLVSTAIEYKMKELTHTMNCSGASNISNHVELCIVLQAAGHDTTLLQAAIEEAHQAAERLKSVSTQAACKFIQETQNT
jgi:hypothetical protein